MDASCGGNSCNNDYFQKNPIFFAKPLDIYDRIWYNIYRKEVNVLSRKDKRKKKSGEKVNTTESVIKLITAIINLTIVIISLIKTIIG